jgi:3-dehydrotetronate 4-kinase
MPVRLGCIADDFTGATDLANTLVRAGMRVVQTINTPAADTAIDADAVVIALKSRTIPAVDAVAQSRQALAWLRLAGAQQITSSTALPSTPPRGAISVASSTR